MRSTMSAIYTAGFAAAAIAMAGAVFGATIARVFWAEDLKHAQRIDAIRSQTEEHLRDQIKAMEKTISVLKSSERP